MSAAAGLTDPPVVEVSQLGRLLVVELNRPQRKNALSRPMLADIVRILTGEQAGQALAVALTGRGGTFSAGADFAELTGTADDIGFDDAVADAVAAIRAAAAPVVALISGACMGAACDLALACDARIAEPSAFFEIPAVSLGLLYNPAAVARMARSLPRDTVRRLLLLGERMDAGTAQRAGLVGQVVPSGAALPELAAVTARRSGGSPEALASTRAMLDQIDGGTFDPARWEHTRRQLLDSPFRRRSVREAHERHLPTDTDRGLS